MSRPNPKNTPLYTAVVTPFDSTGKISYQEFEKLLRLQESAGNGVVILGSTGEGLSLREEERREVVRFTSVMNLSVPVLVGVPGFQLDDTLNFLKFCETQNVEGYLMPVPLYAKPGLEGQFEWFQALLNAVTKPTMIYNVPSRTGVKLRPAVLTRLGNHKNAWAVKEASGSVAEFSEFKTAAPNFSYYCGDDGLLPEFAAAGAIGLVSVASNVWPEATNRYVRLAVSGKTDGLLPLWSTASGTLFLASNPVPVKALLAAQHKIQNSFVRPPLSLKDLNSTEALLAADAKIQTWHAKF